MQGALLIDKPAGPTSHDVVAFVRRTLKVDRAGHTGTLDPLATGLLIVLVGGATRLAQFLAADEKEYIGDVRLGVATPTYDAASLGEVGGWRVEDGGWRVEDGGWRVESGTSGADLETVLAGFRGTFLQMPPPYSAKKIASVPAYEKARKNQQVDLKPVPVTVRELQVLSVSSIADRPSPIDHRPSPIDRRPSNAGPGDLVRLRIAASAGFYVRSLAHDIGQALGCGAHLEALRRTRVGRFRVEDALTLDRVGEGRTQLTSPNELLGHMTAMSVSNEVAQRIAHGNPVAGEAPPGCQVRLLNAAGTLLAIAEARPGGVLQPVVVLR